MGWLIVLGVVVWLAIALLGGWLAAERGRSYSTGFWFGLLFGPLGVIAVGLAPEIKRREMSPLVEKHSMRERNLN
jgi:hypothetical protein